MVVARNGLQLFALVQVEAIANVIDNWAEPGQPVPYITTMLAMALGSVVYILVIMKAISLAGWTCAKLREKPVWAYAVGVLVICCGNFVGFYLTYTLTSPILLPGNIIAANSTRWHPSHNTDGLEDDPIARKLMKCESKRICVAELILKSHCWGAGQLYVSFLAFGVLAYWFRR